MPAPASSCADRRLDSDFRAGMQGEPSAHEAPTRRQSPGASSCPRADSRTCNDPKRRSTERSRDVGRPSSRRRPEATPAAGVAHLQAARARASLSSSSRCAAVSACARTRRSSTTVTSRSSDRRSRIRSAFAAFTSGRDSRTACSWRRHSRHCRLYESVRSWPREQTAFVVALRLAAASPRRMFSRRVTTSRWSGFTHARVAQPRARTWSSSSPSGTGPTWCSNEARCAVTRRSPRWNCP